MKSYNTIGKSIPRLDAPLQVTGRLVYGEDMYRPNMLYAAAKYSDHMHAKILRIDTAKAEKMPGVRAVITHRDVPVNRNGSGIYGVFDQPVLADTKVCYRGDAIAVVAAETKEQARAAAEAVCVEYEPLKAVFTVEEALAPGAPVLHPEWFESNLSHHQKIRFGDTSEHMFDGCDLVLENTFTTQKVDHAPIEPHVALAEIEPDGQIVITTSTSRPFNYIGRTDEHSADAGDDAPHPLRGGGRRLRRKERGNARTVGGTAGEKNRTAGENGVQPRRGPEHLYRPPQL